MSSLKAFSVHDFLCDLIRRLAGLNEAAEAASLRWGPKNGFLHSMNLYLYRISPPFLHS